MLLRESAFYEQRFCRCCGEGRSLLAFVSSSFSYTDDTVVFRLSQTRRFVLAIFRAFAPSLILLDRDLGNRLHPT